MIRDEDAVWIQGILEALLEKLHIGIRYENLADRDGELSLRGGMCRLRGTRVIIIDIRLSPRKRCEMMIDALKGIDMSDVFVPPVLRQLIDDSKVT